MRKMRQHYSAKGKRRPRNNSSFEKTIQDKSVKDMERAENVAFAANVLDEFVVCWSRVYGVSKAKLREAIDRFTFVEKDNK